MNRKSQDARPANKLHSSGSVAVLVDADGTKKIVSTSVVTEGSVGLGNNVIPMVRPAL